MAAAGAAQVFISYRSADGMLSAGFVSAELTRRLGPGRVFRDRDSLQYGRPYAPAIREHLERADVLVAIIGRHWMDRDAAGCLLIDRSEDWVRYEIRRALERKIPLIPVLVDGVSLPARKQLPRDIHGLTSWHALTLNDRAVADGIAELVDALVAGPC